MLNKYSIEVTALKSAANLSSPKPRRELSNSSHTIFVIIKGHSNLKKKKSQSRCINKNNRNKWLNSNSGHNKFITGKEKTSHILSLS